MPHSSAQTPPAFSPENPFAPPAMKRQGFSPENPFAPTTVTIPVAAAASTAVVPAPAPAMQLPQPTPQIALTPQLNPQFREEWRRVAQEMASAGYEPSSVLQYPSIVKRAKQTPSLDLAGLFRGIPRNQNATPTRPLHDVLREAVQRHVTPGVAAVSEPDVAVRIVQGARDQLQEKFRQKGAAPGAPSTALDRAIERQAQQAVTYGRAAGRLPEEILARAEQDIVDVLADESDFARQVGMMLGELVDPALLVAGAGAERLAMTVVRNAAVRGVPPAVKLMNLMQTEAGAGLAQRVLARAVHGAATGGAINVAFQAGVALEEGRVPSAKELSNAFLLGSALGPVVEGVTGLLPRYGPIDPPALTHPIPGGPAILTPNEVVVVAKAVGGTVDDAATSLRAHGHTVSDAVVEEARTRLSLFQQYDALGNETRDLSLLAKSQRTPEQQARLMEATRQKAELGKLLLGPEPPKPPSADLNAPIVPSLRESVWRAAADGYQAGEASKALTPTLGKGAQRLKDNRYPEGSPEHAAYEKAWEQARSIVPITGSEDLQATLARQRAVADDVAETFVGEAERLRAQGVKPELEAPELLPAGVAGELPPERLAQAPTPVSDIGGKPLATPAPQIVELPPPRVPADKIDDVIFKGKPVREPLNWDAWYTNWLDERHPINVATKQLLRLQREALKGAAPNDLAAARALQAPLDAGAWVKGVGARLPGIDDPYVLARLSAGASATATSFIERGPVRWADFQQVGTGLKDIWKPLIDQGRLQELRRYFVAKRADELAKEGMLNEAKFGVSAADAAQVLHDAQPDVAAAANSTARFFEQVVQYAADAGLFPQKVVKQFIVQGRAHVPLWKLIEVPDMPLGSKAVKITDPLENFIKNTYAIVAKAEEYATRDALARLAEGTPGQTLVRRLNKEALKEAAAFKNMLSEVGETWPDPVLRDIAQSLGEEGAGRFWVWRTNAAGKQVRQLFEVDKPLYDALTFNNREVANMVTRLLAAPVRVIKLGATTINPVFPLRNIFRDQPTAAVFSRYGYKPAWEPFKGVFQAVFKNPAEADRMYALFRASGAEHAVLVRSTATERILAQRTVARLEGQSRSLIEALRALSQTADAATRIGEFRRAFKATGDPRIAAFAAREVTLDFQRMGAKMHTLNQIIPFLNPNVQDVDKFVRMFAAEKGANWNRTGAFGRAIAWVGGMGLLTYMLNRNNEAYYELSEARKDFYWNIPTTNGKFVSIPKPFLLGVVFGTGMERVLEWLDKNNPEAFAGYERSFFKSFLPTGYVIPGAILPLVESWTNYSFFTGGPIIPESEQRLIPQEQAGPQQGETVRFLAKQLKVSPRNVEHILQGYTGGLSRLVVSAADAALRIAGTRSSDDPTPRPPMEEAFRALTDPLARAFMTNEPGMNSRSIEKFYERWNDMAALMATARRMEDEGRGNEAAALYEASTVDFIFHDDFAAAARAISELRAEINAVRRDTSLSPEERDASVTALGRTARNIAAEANRAYGDAKAKQDVLDALRYTPRPAGVGAILQPPNVPAIPPPPPTAAPQRPQPAVPGTQLVPTR